MDIAQYMINMLFVYKYILFFGIWDFFSRHSTQFHLYASLYAQFGRLGCALARQRGVLLASELPAAGHLVRAHLQRQRDCHELAPSLHHALEPTRYSRRRLDRRHDTHVFRAGSLYSTLVIFCASTVLYKRTLLYIIPTNLPPIDASCFF